MKNHILISALLIICAAWSPAQAEKGEDKPKSNMFARAKVLSRNELSITISHSDWGKKAAFEFAAQHCAKYNRLAVYQSGVAQWGPDTTSTWACITPAQPSASDELSNKSSGDK